MKALMNEGLDSISSMLLLYNLAHFKRIDI